MVWANARTQNCAPTRSLWVEGMRRGTAGCARPDFLPSHSDRAQPPRNTTSHMLQRGFTATSGWCWAALYGVDCLSLRAAKAASLSVSRAPPLGMSRVSAGGAIIAASTANHRRLSQQNPKKFMFHWCCLPEFSCIFVRKSLKNITTKFLRPTSIVPEIRKQNRFSLRTETRERCRR